MNSLRNNHYIRVKSSITSCETKGNNPDWLNKSPWYNTTICSKLHGILYEDFIRNSRTDRYNIMHSITAHNMQQPKYVDDSSSAGGKEMPNNATK